MKILMSMLLSLFYFFSYAQNTPNELTGKWKTEEGKIITISEADGVFTGKTVAPNEQIIDILQQIKQSKKGYAGKFYAPKKDTKLDCVLNIKSSNTLEITVKKWGMTKVIEWKKI